MEGPMVDVHYALNDAQLCHNTFDKEVVVIHFPTGTYFSLRESAAQIWQALERSPTSAEMLTAMFDRPPADALAQVEDFLRKLGEKGLVVEVATAEQAPPPANCLPF